MRNLIPLAVFAAIVAIALGAELLRRRATPYMPPLPARLRTDLLYGYFGRDAAQCVETAGAVNVAFEMRWDGVAETISRMVRQRVSTILCVSGECWINPTTLRSAGVIGQVVGFYVIDEPDLWGSSDADVTSACATVRRVAAEYTDLGGCALACCYSKSGQYPGVSAFDWVSVDDYPEDSNVLVGQAMSGLRAALREDQRLFLVPGGADPFRGSPEAFRRAAHADPKVIAIVPFLWRDYVDPSGQTKQGIRANGMDAVYRKLGAELVGRA